MAQIHTRFTSEQIRFLLGAYVHGHIKRIDVQEALAIGKSRFFELLREYRQAPATLSVSYARSTPPRLSPAVEAAIKAELLREKKLVEDPRLPISGYNYSALRDRLRKRGIRVSATTITARAKALDCHKPRPKKKVHDRQVLTTAIGALIQHDSSLHLWSPYAQEKWTLITSIDDFSRKLLFADFSPQETTWSHIQAAQALMQAYGIPLRFYVDSLRIFRFVQGRDSVWRKHVLQTDEADPQLLAPAPMGWKQVMQVLGVEVIHALSPQAKGKVERPYGWLQDRIVRTCALENLSTLEEARAVLREEVDRYNNHQVHSTTGEVPGIRFTRAQKEGNSLFRTFALPKPYTSPRDVFCLRERRIVNAYRRISLFGHEIRVPKAALHEEVELHLIPNQANQILDIRGWHKNQMLQSTTLPLEGIRVHF